MNHVEKAVEYYNNNFNCSQGVFTSFATEMGMDEKLAELARRCSREVVVPETNCCGFAGDRGFTYPELNHHGLRELKEQIPSKVKQGYSTSRTCEIGLTHNSGISFKSIVYLVDKVTTRKN